MGTDREIIVVATTQSISKEMDMELLYRQEQA
jgi:hypothetical protein